MSDMILSMPDMNVPYVDILRSRCVQGKWEHTVMVKHHFRLKIFTASVDQRLKELNSKFSVRTTKLLILSVASNPKHVYKSFKINDICNFV